jgi:vesicle transport through interaction with t-SNAREs protein 1
MDTSPTALFDTYEQDFNQFIESIRDKLEGDGKDEVGGASSSVQYSEFHY